MICVVCQEEAGDGLDCCWWCFAKRNKIGPYRKQRLREIVEEKGYEDEDEAIKEKF